jgi:hypothetical protein
MVSSAHNIAMDKAKEFLLFEVIFILFAEQVLCRGTHNSAHKSPRIKFVTAGRKTFDKLKFLRLERSGFAAFARHPLPSQFAYEVERPSDEDDIFG